MSGSPPKTKKNFNSETETETEFRGPVRSIYFRKNQKLLKMNILIKTEW